MSGCLACTDPILPCKCPAGVSCYQTTRSCNACPKNVCASTSSPGSGGGSSLGGTIGGAVGGVVGIIVTLALAYFLWWKPRGLEASRRRYSKHLSNRQSKIPPPPPRRQSAEAVAKRTSVHLRMDGGGASPDMNDMSIRRRTDSPGAAVSFALSGDRIGADSTRAMGGHPRTSLESDNPFADHTRSSIGTFDDHDDAASTRTSDFSFRSSQSTNIIPIAYIPPHSNSMSLDDANRGAFGEVLSDDAIRNSLRPSPTRASVPVSMASRDSLSFVSSDLIDLHPLPPVLNIDKLAVPGQNGAPVRPPRSPGLDLKLPSTQQPSGPTLTSPHASQLGMRPMSSLPSPKSGLTIASGSSNSGSGGQPSPTSSRGMSVLLERSSALAGLQPGSHMSTISSMSAATSRSGSSTMSYILDPPQIITPVNAQGVRRVEVIGRGQAGLVKIQGSAGGISPSISAPVDEDRSASPVTPRAFGSRMIQQQAAGPPGASGDSNPFSDVARSPSSTSFSPQANAGRFSNASLTSQPLSSAIRHTRDESTDTITDVSDVGEGSSPRWTAATIDLGGPGSRASAHSIQFDPEPPSPGFNRMLNPPLSVASSTGLGIPSSARNSTFSDVSATGSRSRPLTGESQWRSSSGLSVERPNSINSFADSSVSASSQRSSSTDAMSMLDGIPFMGPATTELHRASRTSSILNSAPSTPSTTAPRSPLFPMPPQRSPSIGAPPSPLARASTSYFETPLEERSPALETTDETRATSKGPSPFAMGVAAAAEEERSNAGSPLAKPVLPFAGQRPTSTHSELDASAKDRVQSQAISVRSGFASGLSQIPFTLDGGLRDSMLQSERGSMISLGGASEHADYEAASRRTTLLSATGNDEGDLFSDAAGRPLSFASSIGESSIGADDESAEDVVVMQAELRPIARSMSMKKTFTNGTTHSSTSDDASNPFGQHAEVDSGDPRASMDSLAFSAALSRSFEDSQD